jgi:hypothetical protein
MKKIEITPEWILENLSTNLDCKNGRVLISCNDNYHWIKLAFDTLEILYSEDEYIDEDTIDDDIEKFEIQFNFILEDIREECPNLYEHLKKLNENNKKSK